MKKPMKMRSLEEYGIPSYIIDIWEKNYSPFLLPIQEEAVRYYGILDYEEGGNGRKMDSRFHGNDKKDVRNDNLIDSRFLLTLSPTSSGKTFIGEMAAITQAIHSKKAIYLVPLRSLAEEKYRHFKKLYSGKNCPIKILISSRDHREDDHKIIEGEYEIAIMVYEKFNYFLLKYPSLLENISLIIVDELQMIHDPERGPLLEEMIKTIRKNNSRIKLIGLSAYLENEAGFLNWLPAHHLLSLVRPVELRKEEFGRAIFLADSLFAETVLQNIFFKFMKEDSKRHREMISEEGGLYLPALKSGRQPLYRPVKKEKDFTTFLLKAIVDGENSKDKLKDCLKEVTTNFKGNSSYWLFDFSQEDEDLEKEIDLAVEKLREYHLIAEGLSPTAEGILICAKGIDIETYLFFRNYLENKAGKMSNLELITLMALSSEGKRSYLPFPQFNHKTNRCNFNDWKYQYYNQIGELIADQEEEYKEIYQNILGRDKEKISLDDQDYLSIKKAVLLYDWIGEKEIRELEEEHKIYGGSIQKLGEEFSWLADSLRTAAESLGWKMDEPSQKNNPLSQEEKTKKDNWEKVKTLAERLNWGVEEEGLKLARLHIPGLSRTYIKVLLREGYDDKKCLQELSEEELAKVVPERLAERIKKRFPAEICNQKPEAGKPKVETCRPKLETGNPKPVTILEIDIHRPDRIIFEGKEIEVTSKEFSLIHLLAQNRGKILTHNDLLDTIWKEDEDATYVQITYHLYKIRRDILKAIGNNKKNKERVKDILKVISRRGIMLNLKEDKLKIN